MFHPPQNKDLILRAFTPVKRNSSDNSTIQPREKAQRLFISIIIPSYVDGINIETKQLI